MENIEFDNYVSDTLRLVRTLIVKIEAVALKDNSVLEAAGFPVSTDKRTWRYYMNLNGDYHPTDVPMMIDSIDTGESILFSKANLAYHIATKREYARGGYYYNRLVERFEGQADLIKGILNPIPYETTIAAGNYKILGYNKNLILWNEAYLIPELQEFIYGIVPQIFNHEYRYTDNLMLSMGVIILYYNIFMEIKTVRHENIGSRVAHDFYIWARIDSYGEFSKYKESLSKKQIMWLYKNIAWIKNNPGAQYTFDLLMKNLLTDADIPLAHYDLVENTKSQLEDLTPVPLYRKMQLNLQESYGLEPSYIDTQQMILKEQGVAKDNFAHSAIWYDHALNKGTHSLYSELPTKVLESSMMDYTNRHVDTKMSVTFNNWIYLAGKGYYKGRILVTDPKTGKDVRLPVGDAYYLWRYLIDLSKDRVQREICPAYYQNVLKAVPPSVQYIQSIGWSTFVPWVMAYDIRELWIPPQVFVAPEFLMSHSEEIYGIMWKHKKLYSQFYDLNKRAHVKNATETMYESGFITLTDLDTYDQLLDRYELDFVDHSPEEARYFAWEIFKRITGWDTSSNPSLRIKQNALIDIMMQLSSYTIQTIREMDDGKGITEVPNEIFVGDSRYTGPGNASRGDFSHVAISVPSNLDGYRSVRTLVDIGSNDLGTPISSAKNFAKIIDDTTIKVVDRYKDPAKYAVRIQDDSYIRILPRAEKEVPPTFYERLEWIDFNKDIPPTNYGRLEHKDK